MSDSPPHKATKRPHRKSRNGCLECKRRKIKCDETKPCCKKCAVHSMTCSFLQSQPTKFIRYHGEPIPVRPRTVLPTPEYSTQSSSPTSTTTTQGSKVDVLKVPDPSQLGSHLNMVDLELFYHYMMSTSFTLLDDEHWRIIVPQMAFSCDYLMHGILSLTALHVSSLRPEKKDFFVKVSDTHYQQGLKSFQQAVSNISIKNSHSCYAFSLYLIVISWASPTIAGNLFGRRPANVEEQEMVDLITIVRGSVAILRTAQRFHDFEFDGPLKGMFIHWYNCISRPVSLPKEQEEPLDELIEIMATLSSPDEDEKDAKTLQEVLELIRQTYLWSQPESGLTSVSVSIAWLGTLPEDYYQMVNDRNQRALILLAYFCPILKQTDNIWWLKGKATLLLNNIRNGLEPGMEKWIQWPLKMIVGDEESV